MIYIHRPKEVGRKYHQHKSWKRRENAIRDSLQLKPEKRESTISLVQKPPQHIQAFWNDICDVFHDKCAFCESKLDDTAQVTRYRPYGFARYDHRLFPHQDRQDREHYYWLAWEWSNLYVACEVCIRQKEYLFPIQSERAELGVVDVEFLYDSEQPLLLDPCRDNPDAHLEFHDDGHVTAKPGSERGKTTITVLNLNRPDLVCARRESAKVLLQCFQACLNTETINHDAAQHGIEQLKVACQADQVFAGMKRQLLRKKLEFAKQSSSTVTSILQEMYWMFLIEQLDEWLLEGIDKKRPPMVFVSYSHEDMGEKDLLIQNFQALVNNRVVPQ